MKSKAGFGDGTATVSGGTFQAFFGAAAANDDLGANGEVGQLLLRYGVTDELELRSRVGSLALNGPGTEYTGTSVGAKLRLLSSKAGFFCV